MSVLAYPPLLSTEITATTQIFGTQAEVWGVVLRCTDASNPVTLDLRNGTSDTSERLLSLTAKVGEEVRFTLPCPLYFDVALRAVLSGGTGIAWVIWRRF